MATTHRPALVLTFLLAYAGFSNLACSAAPPRSVVHVSVRHPAPPPLRAEVVGARPGPRTVWVAGHYVWKPARKRYVWIEGRWAVPPRGKKAWFAPRYDRRHGVYIAGRWT